MRRSDQLIAAPQNRPGILLAAEIAERISGQPLREFMRERIFQPLGMTHTELGQARGTAFPSAFPCASSAKDWTGVFPSASAAMLPKADAFARGAASGLGRE